MPELHKYCDGAVNDEGCREINQPCMCLRLSWEQESNQCVCSSLDSDDKKVWICGCKACEGINADGVWLNQPLLTKMEAFTPSDFRPTLTVEDDQMCVCGIVTMVGHFCGICPQCKDTCKIYG